MRLAILDTYYPQVIDAWYRADPARARLPYDAQRDGLLGQGFGTADFYSANLRALGHEAADIVCNASPAQAAWAREHGGAALRLRRRRPDGDWSVARAQLERSRPDVVYVQDPAQTPAWVLDAARAGGALVVGQLAAPLDPAVDLAPYDAFFTSMPHFVRMFELLGVPARLLRIGFEATLPGRVGPRPRTRPLVFSGQLGGRHRAGTQVLERLAAAGLPLEVWAPSPEPLAPGSPLRRCYRGSAWGLEVYALYASAQVVLNRHIDVAARHANNMRLFEATGMGACLVTDDKDDLAALFAPGREVLTYRDADECERAVRAALEEPERRLEVAQAGQARTLREHTYAARMQELAGHLEELLRAPRRDGGPRRPNGLASGVWRGAARAALARSRAARVLRPVVRVVRRLLPARGGGASADDQALAPSTESLECSWQSPLIPERQRALVDHQLARTIGGAPPSEFTGAAEALRVCGAVGPEHLVVEVGCASAYLPDALEVLLPRSPRYVGIDYSWPLLALGRRCAATRALAVGDATRLPLADGAADVLFSGGVLLHVREWRRGIHESVRVARRWCVFHRTPVGRHLTASRALTKVAYGVPMMEWTFAPADLEAAFTAAALELRARIVINAWSTPDVGPIELVTFVCERMDPLG